MPTGHKSVPYMRPSLPPYASIADDLERIITTGQLTKGPIVRSYEEALADRLSVRNVVATSSCTLGLTLIYRALGLSGPVIVPSFTFMATVNALVWAGATPVFADVRPDTWTLDPTAVEQALTDNVQAIVAVPVFGAPCDVIDLERIAEGAGIPLVFDSAHGVGSSIRGQPLGGFGRAEVFSTTPTKTLVTGEGGFVTTNDDGLARALRSLVEYGNDGTFDTDVPGLNARLPEISALIGLRMLDLLDDSLAERRRRAARYAEALGTVDGLRLQHIPDDCVSSYKDFTILVEDGFGMGRDELAAELAREGIETKKYFFPAVHRQRPYLHLGFEGALPVTERLERQALSLPLWSAMSETDLDFVIATVLDRHRARAR